MTKVAPQTDTLSSAVMLAAVGGLLDAVVYINHGHVFANAMTGNLILLGVSAVSGSHYDLLQHLIPVLTFLTGVGSARCLRLLPRPLRAYSVLLLEMIVLCTAGFLPVSFPDLIFNATISFASAFQVSTFRQVGRFSYNSTFFTGNLRELADSFISSFLEPTSDHRYRDRAKARKLATICLFFLCGALAGAWAARFGNHAFWLAVPPLLFVCVKIYPEMRHSA